jgi:hypothetical protein
VRIDADGNAPHARRRNPPLLKLAGRYGTLDFDDVQDVRDHAFDAREEPRIRSTVARRCHRRRRYGQHSSH